MLALLLVSPVARSEVRLPSLISDHMVLQQGMKVSIWGWADPGEKITVSFRDQTVTAKTGRDGTWRVELSPLTAGGPFEMTIVDRKSRNIVLHDVLVGEVWLCAGQSNMWWPVKWSLDSQEEITQGRDPEIHLYTVPRCPSPRPLADIRGKWVVCTPGTVAEFSAVGYVFGKELHKILGCPIGLIKSAYGATPAESWTPRKALESDADFRPILERWNRFLAAYPKIRAAYFRQVERWRQLYQKTMATGLPRPPRPQPVQPDPCVHPWLPGGLYNAMIHPLTRYAIKGVIWYQGEQNTDRGYQYRKLFPTLIRNWRGAWRADFPFLFVQLANYMKPPVQPEESKWAELREAQARALMLPKTGMAVSIDVGDANSIHPKDKEDVGKRLALLAEALVYGRDVVYSGPLYDSMKVEGGRIRIRFRHTQPGLATKNNGPIVKGFAIAGADRRFVWAQARIEGDGVVVWSDQVPRPMAVRYAWADNPVCNLYNSAGLPAAPFRTDNWPLSTMNNR
jgi:sialate O-acetylesterase